MRTAVNVPAVVSRNSQASQRKTDQSYESSAPGSSNSSPHQKYGSPFQSFASGFPPHQAIARVVGTMSSSMPSESKSMATALRSLWLGAAGPTAETCRNIPGPGVPPRFSQIVKFPPASKA